jgi:3',5'-cyclic AMP phosphodiesterase CpdA
MRRCIWVLADSHIGHVDDGRDGADWLALSIADMRRYAPRIDYALFLGDASHGYRPEQFRRYVRLRRGSGIRRWYEIAGNHDYHGVESGDYGRIVRAPLRYTVVDGNLAWVFFSAERGRAAGLIGEETAAWLANRLARYQDRNLVVCSHQLVFGTVDHSDNEERFLHPCEVVADLRSRFRVDLWLSGHYHSRPRIPADAVRKDGTTFINVASVSHVYNTAACNSFLLEAGGGSRVMRARCRVHDAGRFDPRFEVRVPFPYPFVFDPLPRRAMPRLSAGR